MKFFFCLPLLTFYLITAAAQQTVSRWKFIPPKISSTHPNQLITFKPATEKISFPVPSDQNISNTHSSQQKENDARGFTSTEIGNTYFDLQTNASICHTLFRDSIGTMHAVWNFAPTIDPDFTTRGTGYNYFNGSSWLPHPTSRIEDVRTGWPNILVTWDNQEFILCHNLQFIDAQLNKRTPPGSGPWTEQLAVLPAPDSAQGMWWPRMVRGDSALGKYYVHAIALTLPTLEGGSIYHGIDGCLLYYRSSDNGATWDKQKVLIAKLDTEYARIRPDNYAIDAFQNEVAIVVGGFGNDLTLFTSPDDGLSWQKTVVQKFPIPRFLDQITAVNGDSIADLVNTNDGSLAVLIDNSGTIHVWAGYNQIYNADSTDGIFSFQPIANGILYWNSNMGAQPMKIITGALDLDNNGTLDIIGYGIFNSGFATHPSAGVDAAGNIFLSYSAIDEQGKDASNKNVRHTYIMAKFNNDTSWSYPYDVVNDINAEGIYGCMARMNDDNIHIIYQKDFCAGLSITSNNPDPCNNGELNTIMYVEVPASEILSSNGIVNVSHDKKLLLYPNPSAGMIYLSLPIQRSLSGAITVCDVNGKIVYQTQRIISSEEKLDISFLPAGFYAVHIATDEFSLTSKVAVVK